MARCAAPGPRHAADSTQPACADAPLSRPASLLRSASLPGTASSSGMAPARSGGARAGPGRDHRPTHGVRRGARVGAAGHCRRSPPADIGVARANRAPPGDRMPALIDRDPERAILDQLLERAGAGRSQSLVLHGNPGVGKTALLRYLTDRAGWFRVIRVAGMQSGMELAFSGLRKLCEPVLDRLSELPAPQREAL